ncbi:MAG: hypothetical protein SR2Q5_07835 [Quinella sp. 2Q5]|nr:hypothetical protein [Quinella sp. 2Q5]
MGKDIKVDDLDNEIIYRECLRNGLTALTNDEYDDDEKVLVAYFYMRPLDMYDFKNNSTVLKKLTGNDKDLIGIFYKDMCEAIHVERRDFISFRTKISSVESAKFVLVSLACGILGKDVVEGIMDDCGVSLDECLKPLIELRKKERRRLEYLRERYGDRGLDKYLRLTDEERDQLDDCQAEYGKRKGVEEFFRE